MKLVLKKKIQMLWKDESAQGATEYILLLAIVVGIAMAFGPKIKGKLAEKFGEVSAGIDAVRTEGN